MKQAKNTVQICLCSKCAGVFYSSATHKIYRADPLQVITDECFFCRSSRGFDYSIETIPFTKKPSLKLIVDAYV